MIRLARASAVVLLSTATALAWSPFAPKVSFERRVPAPHNLGPMKTLVLVEARGSDTAVQRLADKLLDAAKRDGAYELLDGRSTNTHLGEVVDNKQKLAKLKKTFADADAFAGLELHGCNSHNQSDTHTEKDKHGNKSTVTEYWVDADCSADLRIVDARDGRELVSATIDGNGSTTHSKYYASSSSAINDAIDDTALNVLRAFTPRRDKQTLVLERSAPSFKEAMDHINAKRYAEAQKVWQAALASNPNNAALHLDLAEISEVVGDVPAAKTHYEEAARLDSSDTYRKALKEFQKRLDEDHLLATRP